MSTKNTQLRGVTSLTKKQSGNSLRINTVDAASASIRDGDRVKVTTENGIAAVQANVTDDIRPGVVSLTHGWGRRLFHPETRTTPEQQGTNANLLTGDENLDELCGMPVHKAIPCSVVPEEGRGEGAVIPQHQRGQVWTLDSQILRIDINFRL